MGQLVSTAIRSGSCLVTNSHHLATTDRRCARIFLISFMQSVLSRPGSDPVRPGRAILWLDLRDEGHKGQGSREKILYMGGPATSNLKTTY